MSECFEVEIRMLTDLLKRTKKGQGDSDDILGCQDILITSKTSASLTQKVREKTSLNGSAGFGIDDFRDLVKDLNFLIPNEYFDFIPELNDTPADYFNVDQTQNFDINTHLPIKPQLFYHAVQNSIPPEYIVPVVKASLERMDHDIPFQDIDNIIQETYQELQYSQPSL